MTYLNLLSFYFLFSFASPLLAQSVDDLELLDAADAEILKESPQQSSDLSEREVEDELNSLSKESNDLDSSGKESPNSTREIPQELIIEESVQVLNEKSQAEVKKPKIFDVGREEQTLLELAQYVQGKIPEDEWNEIAAASQVNQYVVQEGDWLWKISKRLFGSGFYYSKVWSLNPQITNPHQIEPGMVLVFDTGSADQMPDVKVGEFDKMDTSGDGKISQSEYVDFERFSMEKPKWLVKREKLREQGVYFEYASETTYEDLMNISKQNLVKEYEKYEPPIPEIFIEEPGDQYDDQGFDKSSIISYDVKEGFYLNTFITTNIIQDLGFIDASQNETVFLHRFDRIYVNFNSGTKVKPGDLFSIYLPEGEVENDVSERTGRRYSIGAQIKALKKVNNLWECEVTEVSGQVRRDDRVTTYTPRINKIIKTFSQRNIEAAIIDSYKKSQSTSFGDVVYLDRGRSDGVEMGNVFQVYSFHDQVTGKRITPDPTYKVGELTVITLTDNFATALVTQSKKTLSVGDLAFTKTEEDAARLERFRKGTPLGELSKLEREALEDLDVELSVDDLSDDLLDKADQIQLTEDELEELERQEREKSIIQDNQRDIEELERIEAELLDAEKSLNEARVDEDKFLEQMDLDDVERRGEKDPNAFEDLNEIEREMGKKYLDEGLNDPDNHYGLNEYDLEEIDKLLNTQENAQQ